MTLAALIRKGGLAEIATATRATDATYRKQPSRTVASVATVAVAYPEYLFDSEAYDERAALIEGNGIPREWAEGYATLCTMPPPTAYTPEFWQRIVDDGGYFLDQWGRQAAALGWRAVDVFGVNPDAPWVRLDGMGLVPLLAGRRVCAITADTARIECGNNIPPLTFYRQRLSSDTAALWKLAGRI